MNPDLRAATSTCDVVCFAALHEHGYSAHVQQLRARLHVEREVCKRSCGANGDAAAVMPYGNVIDDIEHGRITGRRIVNPPLKRTLYLVRLLRRAQFKHEDAVLELLATVSRQFADKLGPLATCLEALNQPLAATLTAMHVRAQEAT